METLTEILMYVAIISGVQVAHSYLQGFLKIKEGREERYKRIIRNLEAEIDILIRNRYYEKESYPDLPPVKISGLLEPPVKDVLQTPKKSKRYWNIDMTTINDGVFLTHSTSIYAYDKETALAEAKEEVEQFGKVLEIKILNPK